MGEELWSAEASLPCVPATRPTSDGYEFIVPRARMGERRCGPGQVGSRQESPGMFNVKRQNEVYKLPLSVRADPVRA